MLGGPQAGWSPASVLGRGRGCPRVSVDRDGVVPGLVCFLRGLLFDTGGVFPPRPCLFLIWFASC